jgi:hypothetical protein
VRKLAARRGDFEILAQGSPPFCYVVDEETFRRNAVHDFIVVSLVSGEHSVLVIDLTAEALPGDDLVGITQHRTSVVIAG